MSPHLQGENKEASLLHADYLLGLFLDREDGGDIFLGNIGLVSADCVA
jgi:hypothetical protein